LKDGARVDQVEEVVCDGRTLLRIEIFANDPVLAAIQAVDLQALEMESRRKGKSEKDLQRELDLHKHANSLPRQRIYEYHLDPQLNYAIRHRTERYPDGTLLIDMVADQFEQLHGRDTWLPRSVRMNEYMMIHAFFKTFPSPALITTAEVSEFKTTPISDSQFALDYSMPGSIMRDETVTPPMTPRLPV